MPLAIVAVVAMLLAFLSLSQPPAVEYSVTIPVPPYTPSVPWPDKNPMR